MLRYVHMLLKNLIEASDHTLLFNSATSLVNLNGITQLVLRTFQTRLSWGKFWSAFQSTFICIGIVRLVAFGDCFFLLIGKVQSDLMVVLVKMATQLQSSTANLDPHL